MKTFLQVEKAEVRMPDWRVELRRKRSARFRESQRAGEECWAAGAFPRLVPESFRQGSPPTRPATMPCTVIHSRWAGCG